MENKNGSLLNVIAIILFILLLLAFALFYWRESIFSPSMKYDRDVVKLPRVTTTVTSSSGTDHGINTKITLELSKGLAKKHKTLDVNEKLTEAISGLEYDELAGSDGYDYLKDAVWDCLMDYYTEDELKEVYLTEIVRDVYLPQENVDYGKMDSLLDRLKWKK